MKFLCSPRTPNNAIMEFWYTPCKTYMWMLEENQAQQVTPQAAYKELFSSFSMWLSLWYSSIPIFCLCKIFAIVLFLFLGRMIWKMYE